MTSDLERAVAAIQDDLVRQCADGTEYFNMRDDGGAELEGRFDLESLTRAALDALLEPSEGLVQAIWTAASGRYLQLGPAGDEDVKAVWQAALRHILDQKREG